MKAREFTKELDADSDRTNPLHLKIKMTVSTFWSYPCVIYFLIGDLSHPSSVMQWTRHLTLLVVITATSASCLSSEWKEHENMCYWASSPLELTWTDAQRICPVLFPGADMVSIHGIEQDAFIAEEVADGHRVWIGLHQANDSAPWEWTDGTPIDYTNWYGGDQDCSNRSGSGECCAIINWHNEGAWGGAGGGCSDNRNDAPFMCQIAAS